MAVELERRERERHRDPPPLLLGVEVADGRCRPRPGPRRVDRAGVRRAAPRPARSCRRRRGRRGRRCGSWPSGTSSPRTPVVAEQSGDLRKAESRNGVPERDQGAWYRRFDRLANASTGGAPGQPARRTRRSASRWHAIRSTSCSTDAGATASSGASDPLGDRLRRLGVSRRCADGLRAARLGRDRGPDRVRPPRLGRRRRHRRRRQRPARRRDRARQRPGQPARRVLRLRHRPRLRRAAARRRAPGTSRASRRTSPILAFAVGALLDDHLLRAGPGRGARASTRAAG